MADLKQYVKEKTDMDSRADRPDIARESLKNGTSSPKNNASGLPVQLSSDGPAKASSGAQLTPFVHNSVPAVPHADNASPTGALVNGPASHPASDEPRAPNKGSVSPRKAQCAKSAGGKLASPQVPDPPGEFRPDALKDTVGPFPEMSCPSTNSNGSEVLGSGPPPRKSGSEVRTGQTGKEEGPSSGTTWGFQTRSSEGPSIDCSPGWGPRKGFPWRLWTDCHEEKEEDDEEGYVKKTKSLGQRWRKHKLDTVEAPSLSLASKTSQSIECPIRVHAFRKKPALQSSMDLRESVVAIKQFITRAPTKKHLDGNGLCQVDGFSLAGKKFTRPNAQSLTGSGSEEDPSSFPCSMCNINFLEKKQLRRHMMHHSDGRDEVCRAFLPQTFICKECGRSFRDRGSLLKHITVHLEKREKLMEEIKGLNEPRDDGRAAAGQQCPRGDFRTSRPETFIWHSETHVKDTRRGRDCKDSDTAAATEREAETYRRVERALGYAPGRGTFVFEKSKARVPVFSCRVCPFSGQSESALEKHVELAHRRLHVSDFGRPSYDGTNGYAFPQFPREYKNGDSQRLQLSPKFCIQRQAFRKRAELPFWSDLFIKSKSAQKACKGFGSSPSRWGPGSLTNKRSPFSRQSDKPRTFSLQLAKKIDVTTGLPYDEDCKNDRELGSMFSRDAETPKSILSCYKPLVPKIESSSTFHVGHDSANGTEDNKEPDCGRLTVTPVTKKSPSKRKMSTPYHNTTDRTTHIISSKHEHIAKRHVSEDSGEDTYNFSDYTSEATANFLDCSENEQNPYARNYFIRRQRGPVKKRSGLSADTFETNDRERDCGETQRFTVKEECMEVSLAPLESVGASLFGPERRSCPYCPAMFESGVGLSNHVRGHLHRVGLGYDARHMVTAEQVASRDRTQRVRKKAPLASRRTKKAEKQESQTEHTCPLCGGWFDTKTGLSNHVRGHLKRIGKMISSTSKSPVCILNEMMKDEEEYRNILQALNKKRSLSRPFVSQKFAGSDGLFLTPNGIPVKVQHACRDGEPWSPSVPRPREDGLEKPEVGAWGPPSNSLIELLEKKKLDEELEIKNCSQSIRKHSTMSLPNESSAGAGVIGWPQEKSEITKKVCLHCSATFPSAVSLSNHLRAYARQKRAVLLEGMINDCKQKKTRSRPGPKKKVFAVPRAADEIYRLTCRFCDLVFQGPLSVQEDWIKHLQRHIMNASVPCTGAGMVEVTALPAEPASTPEETAPPLVPQAAAS